MGPGTGGDLSCSRCRDPAEGAQPRPYHLPLVLMCPPNKDLHPLLPILRHPPTPCAQQSARLGGKPPDWPGPDPLLEVFISFC